jgi:ABC-2 type transport system ATP-binding protein
MVDAVRVENLTRRFGDFTAVDSVSFAVSQGEIFGFLGPNGAGKTTTIKMLTALLRPTSGHASVAGYDVVSEPGAIKHRIGYMSQLFSLYGDLTVVENITLFAGLYGVTGERLRERRAWVLQMADLDSHQDQLTATLPLGWKQRLALGCALIHEPSILFLDEPTSGVDPIARRSFWDLIDSIATRGTTVFVSTHYLEEAEYCHRLALMNRGRVIALATPQELRARMIDPILEIATPDPPRAVEVLQEVPGVIEASMYGRLVHAVVDDLATAQRALPAALTQHGLGCEGVSSVTPSLEDVFVALVRQQGGATVG